MSEQQQQRSEESLRHEYSEVAQNVRHYSNLRFAMFTIFFAVSGGVGFVAFGRGQFNAQAAFIARISGFPVIAFFWWYFERLDQLLAHHVAGAAALDRSLGYTNFSSRPVKHHFRAVGRIFFVLLTLLWVYAVYSVPLGS